LHSAAGIILALKYKNTTEKSFERLKIPNAVFWIAWRKNNILTNTKLLQAYQVSLSFPVSLRSQKSTLFTVYFTSRENTQERVGNNCIHLRVHITFCSKSMVYSLRVLELLPSSKQLQCRLEISQYSCAFWGCHGYLHSAYGFCSLLTLWSPVPKLICL